MVINGSEERVVMTVPRNGVFYTLDVRTGKTILPPRGIDGQPVATLNQIDLKALAASSPSASDSNQGAVWEEAQRTATANAPVTSMGHAWFPMGYNAQTGLVYIPSLNLCMDMEGAEPTYKRGTFYLAFEFDLGKSGPGGYMSELIAWDPIK